MSYRIYPVINCGPECNDYEVKVNGAPVELNTARVSAIPFNRRWPGHQRDISQSETVQFLSMCTDEAIEIEITPREAFDAEKLKIRPRSLGIVPTVTEDGKIRFTLPRAAYLTVEPYGRNRALHIFADPVCDYGVDKTAENVIYYGAGEHDVGQIELHSGETLFIDEGAVVYACIKANEADDIKIVGRGILDNSRNKEKILFEVNAEENYAAVKNAKRQHTVQLEYCNNVLIDGITIRDSLVYNIRPLACDNFKVKNVKIIGCWRFNSDGIDMHNCTNVHIDACFLRDFDDCLCIKGFDCYYQGDVEAAVREAMYKNGKRYDTFKNVVVENCVVWNDWGKCLEIGAETRAEEIANIEFRNCDIIHAMGPVLDCMNVDYADVHDVTFKNINVELDEDIPKYLIQRKDADVFVNTDPDYKPYTISVTVEYHKEYSAGGARRGRNRDITFENIRMYGDRAPRLRFGGFDAEHRTENILISGLYHNDVRIDSADGTEWEDKGFTSNVRIVSEEFAQMEKNTVDARNQLKESSYIRFENPDGKGKRVMFVGNSITLHGVRPEVGWYNVWGMAASSADKDYVHRLKKEIKQRDPDAAFCICQASGWEVGYKEGSTLLSKYADARNFGADIIIIRLIENCKARDFESEVFEREYAELIKYLDGKGEAKVIVTTGFWKHPADKNIAAVARDGGYDLVDLSDLGEDDKMKAIGLFEHSGVANHPGDEGMKAIAERIAEVLKKYV